MNLLKGWMQPNQRGSTPDQNSNHQKSCLNFPMAITKPLPQV